MIIAGFGTTYATAYQLPTLQGEDDWSTSRPPVVAQVGGMHGAFDYYGTRNYPIQPITVKKSFMLTRVAHNITGAGVVNIDEGFTPKTVTGSGSSFLTEARIGDTISVDGENRLISSVSSDTLLYVTVDFSNGHVDSPYSLIRENNYTGLDLDLDYLKASTVTLVESKLWGLLRNGSTRWAYAKCTGLTAPENYQNKLAIPVSLEFMLREGVWYGATQSGTSITQASGSYSLTNAGNANANFELTLTSATGTLTQVVITNTTNGYTFTWAGSATVGQTLIINSASYTVTKAGVGAYSGLTYGANQINWLRLAPGANTVTIAVTGSTAWSGSMAWWDTYL